MFYTVSEKSAMYFSLLIVEMNEVINSQVHIICLDKG